MNITVIFSNIVMNIFETYLSSTYENFMFNECFDKNVLESRGTSMFDGCGTKRAIPMN